MSLKDLIDLGMQGLLVYFLALVWQRLNKVTDQLVSMSAQRHAEIMAFAKIQGVNVVKLEAETAKMLQT